MAHIICITGGLTGMLNASLALVDQLVRAGHRITYASPANLKAAVTAQGIDYVQLDPWVIQSGEPPTNRWQQWRTLKSRQQRAVDALGLANFIPTIRDLKPDLILIDMEMRPHVMAVVAAQLPVALLCQFLSIWKRPHLPPIHTRIVPGRGWSGSRWCIAMHWWRHRWQKWLEFQRERWRRMGLDWISIVRCYAKQLDYPWQQVWRWDQWLLPYPQGNLPILCFNALELDFPHDPHPLMHYVGPMVLKTRYEPRAKPAIEADLNNIFARCRTEKKSLIYCSCSTLANNDQHFLQRLITSVTGCSDWELILGLGGQFTTQDLPKLPHNIHAFAWVPQLKVLQQADCAINTGGINSINECLYFGVPMLVYSLGQFDQNGDASRVAYQGVGIAGDIARDQPEQIRHHIQTLLKESQYQTQVARMQACYHHYSQKNYAAQVVKSLLQQTPPTREDVCCQKTVPYGDAS
ncbi:MAG: nucleotide disphospho-sugar-binding domain-containing protein [Cyanobacteria bacterium J06632_22]